MAPPPLLPATSVPLGTPGTFLRPDVPLGSVGHQRVAAQVLQFAVVDAHQGDVGGLEVPETEGHTFAPARGARVHPEPYFLPHPVLQKQPTPLSSINAPLAAHFLNTVSYKQKIQPVV